MATNQEVIRDILNNHHQQRQTFRRVFESGIEQRKVATEVLEADGMLSLKHVYAGIAETNGNLAALIAIELSQHELLMCLLAQQAGLKLDPNEPKPEQPTT